MWQQQTGVQGVPFFVFDNKHARGHENSRPYWRKVWEEGVSPQLTVLNATEGDSRIDGCD
jgi:hypothetical protein